MGLSMICFYRFCFLQTGVLLIIQMSVSMVTKNITTVAVFFLWFMFISNISFTARISSYIWMNCLFYHFAVIIAVDLFKECDLQLWPLVVVSFGESIRARASLLYLEEALPLTLDIISNCFLFVKLLWLLYYPFLAIYYEHPKLLKYVLASTAFLMVTCLKAEMQLFLYLFKIPSE